MNEPELMSVKEEIEHNKICKKQSGISWNLYCKRSSFSANVHQERTISNPRISITFWATIALNITIPTAIRYLIYRRYPGLT
jgi:hypothetical protein